MIGRIALLILAIVFGILSYVHSDEVITKKFVVTEKVKTGDNLYLKYQDTSGEAIFDATPEQYIDANVGTLFAVRESQKIY